MSAKQTIDKLVQRFERNLDDYRSGRYNETQLRREFVDPFFIALGWDVNNEKGYAERYKDVIHEDQVKVGGATKAPDYSFRVGGARKFFVETKKPSINLKDDISPAFQVRRYAWSAKLPLSVLTDFEEFAVYDCRSRPAKTNKAATARIQYLTYAEYLDRWDEIAEVFSKDAVLQGAFDHYTESETGRRGTQEVDKEFLAELESWRTALARNFALRNPGLDVNELNFAVQRTIDRIIFLRIAEDRGLEEYGRLKGLVGLPNLYQELGKLFAAADDRYNSGLFHFETEKGRAGLPDELTLDLQLDDKVLRDILGNLYYPDSPYEFSVLPADILGQVYEQFLGKVIRLTPAHRAAIEEKPEVRKAGGVYYTPTYIVEYIVEHTVGKLLEGKTPRQVRYLRVLDPACGSGSFLIGAYQYLLDWHLEQYVADDPEKHARVRRPRLYQGEAGEWRLTIEERKRILLDNIYGVDIDLQAVEVTKLSLLLKVLEGEKRQQLEFFQERVLPDLGDNIKCGNSLVGPDFYEGQQIAMFDAEERRRINAFDWQSEFPSIMDAGGFDTVIGNPPYIRIQVMKEWAPLEVGYYKKTYQAASKGNYDIYVIFVERGLSLLNDSGKLGYILPSKFLTTDYGKELRTIISKQRILDTVVDFEHAQVFQGATTYTVLLFLNTARPPTIRYLKTEPKNVSLLKEREAFEEFAPETIDDSVWSFLSHNELKLKKKLEQFGIELLDLPAKMSRGSSSGADDVFVLREENDTLRTIEGELVSIEQGILRRPLFAKDFTRFSFYPQNSQKIIFPYSVSEAGYELFEEKYLMERFPNAYTYLKSQKEKLIARKQYKEWFSFSAPRNLHFHDSADILVPLLANRGLFSLLEKSGEEYCLMASGGFSVSLPADINPFYVLGITNSRVIFWHLKQISNKFRGGWITCTKQYFGKLPIRQINLNDTFDATNHDRVVSLVETIIELHSQLEGARTPQQKTALQRQIHAIDEQIDRLVYELYGLTEEEIAIVEETTGS